MNKILPVVTLLIVIFQLAFSTSSHAVAPPALATPNGLSISQVKFTGDEYLVLVNNTAAAVETSNYWLTTYNNVNPMTAGVSSSSQQLPAATLLPGQTLLLSSSPMQTCGASIAGKLSIGLTDSGGFLQLAQSMISSNGAITQIPGDYLSWSTGSSGTIQNVPSSTKSPRTAYYRYSKLDSFPWQQAEINPTDSCQLNIVVAGGSGSSTAVTPLTLAATSPPATILGSVESVDGAAIAAIPAGNSGLNAPQISELLPNPLGVGNDATDEYIELYNPNPKPFELTGYTLVAGLKTLKSYSFPGGTVLEPMSFKAFGSKDTKITLSNTSSQAGLLDPFDRTIAISDTYKTAKDGIAWASANGKWLWTTRLTPGSANIIQQPPIKKSKAKAVTKKKLTLSGANGSSSVQANQQPNANGHPEKAVTSKVHFWVLALVGGLALLYGAYEYRRDLANQYRWCRTKLGFGIKTRPPT